MKKFKLLSLAGLVVVIAMASCSKGSNGATGATGATGPAGPAGPDSVLHSSWTVLALTVSSITGTDTLFTQSITAPAITQQILDSGVVLSYLAYYDNNSNFSVETPLDFNVEEVYTVGNIAIYAPTDYSGELEYRYVIIPGTILSNSTLKGMSKAQIQNLSYKQVTDALANVGSATSN